MIQALSCLLVVVVGVFHAFYVDVVFHPTLDETTFSKASLFSPKAAAGPPSLLNMTLCHDKCQGDCKSYVTPIGVCFSSGSLFPDDPSWSGLDVLDELKGTDSTTYLHRTIFPSQKNTCEGKDSSDSFDIPLDACVGPFGEPRPWGTFELLPVAPQSIRNAGIGCGDNYPGVYARVSSAIDWIQSVARDTWNSNGSFCGGGGSPTSPTDGSCVELKLEFKTDCWPANGVVIEGSGFEAERVYNFDACVPEDICTTLSFFDEYGDGILGDGYLVVTWNRQEIFNGWYFGSGIQWKLGNGCGRESQRAPAPDAPTPPPVVPTSPPEASTVGNCAHLRLFVRTDFRPNKTYFSLENDVDGIIWDVQGNLLPDREYMYQTCIPTDQCAILDVTDTYGDGLIDNGYMLITWGNEVLFNNEDIGYGFTLVLGEGCA